MNVLNFIYDLTNSNALYYILIILLVVISLIMLYLMYSQNKEISRQLLEKNKREEVKEEVKRYEEIESLDGREELLEVSRMTIPKHLEYTQSLFSNTELEELQSISKDIEENYRDRQNDIDTYEEEQEESAIISYEELLSKTQVIPKVEDTKDYKKSNETYSHEEDFLNRLKNLNNNLK